MVIATPDYAKLPKDALPGDVFLGSVIAKPNKSYPSDGPETLNPLGGVPLTLTLPCLDKPKVSENNFSSLTQ